MKKKPPEYHPSLIEAIKSVQSVFDKGYPVMLQKTELGITIEIGIPQFIEWATKKL